MKKTIFTVLGTFVATIVLVGVVVLGNERYHLSRDSKFETIYGKRARIIEQWGSTHSTKGAVMQIVSGHGISAKYARIDDAKDVKGKEKARTQKELKEKGTFPLNILHFPYGAYKALDFDAGKTDESIIYVLLSNKEDKCTKDNIAWIDVPYTFSLLEREIRQNRINQVKSYYEEKTPCKDWGDMMDMTPKKMLISGTGSIQLPNGDETMKNKTVFVFILNREKDIKRTLKK